MKETSLLSLILDRSKQVFLCVRPFSHVREPLLKEVQASISGGSGGDDKELLLLRISRCSANEILCTDRVIQVILKLALQWLPCLAPGVTGSALGLVGLVSVYSERGRDLTCNLSFTVATHKHV